MTPGGYGHKALCKPFKIIIVAWVLDTQPKLDLTAALRYFFLPQIITNRFHAGTRKNILLRFSTDGWDAQVSMSQWSH